MWLLIPVLLTLHIAVCLLLVLAILMQLPRSEGLGAAFGGGMTDNIFGAQTTNVLAKFTVWLGVAFFVLTLALAITYSKLPASEASVINKELMAAPVPEASPDTAVAPGETAPAESTGPAALSPSPQAEGGASPVMETETVEAEETVETVSPEAPAEDAPAEPTASPATP